MTYLFNPTAIEKAQLPLIRWNESRGNYQAHNPKPGSTASGAYGFINRTWAWVASNTGVGRAYASAAQATALDQDTNALWLLRQYGANSSVSWAASGPYPSAAAIAYMEQWLA